MIDRSEVPVDSLHDQVLTQELLRQAQGLYLLKRSPTGWGRRALLRGFILGLKLETSESL